MLLHMFLCENKKLMADKKITYRLTIATSEVLCWEGKGHLHILWHLERDCILSSVINIFNE